MKTVTVKGIEIGDGQPKVCVPIVASEDKAILEMASRLNHSEADIIEWRVDCYSEVKNLQKTIRSIMEGGNAQLSNADYYALNCEAANYADIVDVEIIRDEATAAMLIAELKDKGAYVLGSNHDFSETPEVKEIVLRLCEMQDLGADIVKIAAMPNSPADVITMLTATEENLKTAAKLLCQWLNLKDENAKMYVQAVIPQLSMWIGDNIRSGNVEKLFI